MYDVRYKMYDYIITTMIYFSGSWRPPWSTLEAWRRGRRGRRPPTTVSPSWTRIEWCSLLMPELEMVIKMWVMMMVESQNIDFAFRQCGSGASLWESWKWLRPEAN